MLALCRRLSPVLNALLFSLLAVLISGTAQAQPKQFGDLAEGPYGKLVIQNVMVIPGHGGPPVGPYDLMIEGNTITQMMPFDAVTAAGRGQDNPENDRPRWSYCSE